MTTPTKKNTSPGWVAEYMELVARLPLVPITSDSKLDAASKKIDELLDRDRLGRGAERYLEVLSDLVEKYENSRHAVERVSDAELLEHLMDAKGVRAAEVARETKIVESTLSNVLKGKRAFTREHIGRLSRYFGVGPSVFTY
ncbi:hypothetical protein Mal64_15220 [Pseudobythopirellula maris]|uniref:HTH cro/C1-type domain-containing protein n=1 Tax=Pseudobythopirellula maris TaxID=2527991 RepID=A0A5C5ZXW4_9BACT|nr:helix-turn-helix domain-containing protein [Pseudobythopirellula maris]TWT91123.1 hypothetical protein Mal64_15220 [Pseudobythopirellula maris]